MKEKMIGAVVRYQLKKESVLENTISNIKRSFKSKRGEGYVDTGVKVLMAVVIGALVLGGLYALFKSIILPTMNTKITEMFNFTGN